MPDVEQIPSLIGDIYDAALDPSRWTSVLQKTRDVVGGSAAAVFSKDARSRNLNVYYHCGSIDPRYQELYIETYEKLDPSTTAHVLGEIGETIGTADFMALDDFHETRFYQEWGRPQGLVDFAAAVLDRTATGAILFGVFRQQQHGLVDDDTRWRMRQIVPHIRRAMLIGKAIEFKTARADAFAETLDGLSAGMFLVDQDGRIIHANASGHALLGEGAALCKAGDRMRPTDAAAARALKEIVAAASTSDHASGIKGIAVPLTGRDGEPYAAHVLPLASGRRHRVQARYSAVAAVFIRKAEIETPSPPEVIAQHYQLTPTELRVLLAIVEVGGVRETSDALGIGESTVKTHLHRLFSKTRTSRQADLVKLVASFSSPLLG
jgi:DNA-binding CsgD family transcriptional regulator/PAS domain-containing protein